MDKSPIFIIPYHIKEEGKKILDIEIPRNIIRRFSTYSSPVMLISRKVMKDRSCNRF